MGMQCHFNVSDIPSDVAVTKDFECIDDDGLDYYIIVHNHKLYHFSTDSEHESAWFDIGSRSDSAMDKIQWLIKNRICFNCS